MRMFNDREKVQTPLGVGVVVALGSTFNDVESYRVRFTLPKDENGYLQPIIEFPHYHLKPYRTAHERLLDRNYKFQANYNGEIYYIENTDRPRKDRLVFYIDTKCYKAERIRYYASGETSVSEDCPIIDLELLDIIKQYLLEGVK